MGAPLVVLNPWDLGSARMLGALSAGAVDREVAESDRILGIEPTASERVKESFKLKKIKTPRAAAPAAACVPGRSRACERITLKPPSFRNSPPLAPPQKPKPLVQPLQRRHACLAGPPANTCSRNSHQNKTQSPIVIPEFSFRAAE